MSDILCVTNRTLCKEDFLVRVEKLAAAAPGGIILREKDLGGGEYRELAVKVLEICERYGTICILHKFVEAALGLGYGRIHLPLPALRELSEREKKQFSVLGASCHSEVEAVEAEKLGCTYITAGHVFDTDCKKGTPGRGTEFLREVCKNVSIPVYAIGGITAGRMAEVLRAGAAGACVMSSAMTCGNVEEYLSSYKKSR